MFDTPLCFPAARQYHGYGQELDDGHGRLSEDCESGGCRGLFCLGSRWGMRMGPWGDLWLQTACTSVYSSNTYIYIHIYIHTHSWIVGTSPTIRGYGYCWNQQADVWGPERINGFNRTSMDDSPHSPLVVCSWSSLARNPNNFFPECFSPHFFRLSCLLRFIISIYRLKFTLW